MRRVRLPLSSGDIVEVKFRKRIIVAHLFLFWFDLLNAHAQFWLRLADNIYADINFELGQNEFADDARREMERLTNPQAPKPGRRERKAPGEINLEDLFKNLDFPEEDED